MLASLFRFNLNTMKNLILAALAAFSFVSPAFSQDNSTDSGLTIFFGDEFLTQSDSSPDDLPAGLQNVTFPFTYGIMGLRPYRTCGVPQIGQVPLPPYSCDFWGGDHPWINLTSTSQYMTAGSGSTDLPNASMHGVLGGYGATAGRVTGRKENSINLCHPAGDIGVANTDPENMSMWQNLINPSNTDPLVIEAAFYQMLDDMRAQGAFGTENKIKFNGIVFHLFASGEYGPMPPQVFLQDIVITTAVQQSLAMNYRLRFMLVSWAASTTTIGGPPQAILDLSDMKFLPVRKPFWDAPAWGTSFAAANGPLNVYQQAVADNWVYGRCLAEWDTVLQPQNSDLLKVLPIDQVLSDMGADTAWNATDVQYLHSPSPLLSNWGAFLVGKDIAARIL